MTETKKLILDGISKYISEYTSLMNLDDESLIRQDSSVSINTISDLTTHTMKYPKTPAESYKKPIGTLKKSDILDMLEEALSLRYSHGIKREVAEKIFDKYIK